MAHTTTDRRASPALGGLAAALSAALLAAAAPSAQATFPGKPGPIAFERIVNPKDEGSAQIFSVARPRAKARRLTSGGNGFNPDYSPDGERIVFERRFGGVMPDAMFTMGSDGSSPARIQTVCRADPCLGDNSPAWSPDGTRIAFNSPYEGQGAAEIYTVRPGGSGLKRLRKEPEGSASFEPSWSPNAKRIAFAHGTRKRLPHIWTMKRNGKSLRQLTRGSKPDVRPDWGS